jgi:hypothetical protein
LQGGKPGTQELRASAFVNDFLRFSNASDSVMEQVIGERTKKMDKKKGGRRRSRPAAITQPVT